MRWLYSITVLKDMNLSKLWEIVKDRKPEVLHSISNSETPWTVVCQVPLSMVFSIQEYWSRLSCPSPGELPNSGFEPGSFLSPASAGRFFMTSTTWEAP